MAAGQTYADVKVRTKIDYLNEATERFYGRLSAVNSYDSISDSSESAYIYNVDQRSTYRLDTRSHATEGGEALFRIYRSGNTSKSGR